MSINSNVANLSITVVKTLVKMAGFRRVADMIDSGQECLNLLADIKNDALGDPNAEMIRSLNSAVKSELDTIQDALKHNGLGRKQVKQAAAQLAEAARETIKNLVEDDDALIRAVQQPLCFAEQLRGHAAPLPDYSSDEMHTHYETLLDRLAEEFLTLAPWSPNFNRVALTSLLRCFPALSERIDRLEQHMDRRFDYIELGMREDRDIHIENNQLLKGLSRQNASPIFDHVVFGSRPDVVAGDSFVPRGEQEQLNALIADPTRRRTVLVGMRGCGKTQLAAALAEKCEDKNWSLVAWVNAVSSDSIKSSLVELAKKLKIDTSDQPTPETIIRRCFDQLKSEDPSDRLIIFDNVENIDDLRGLVPRGNGLRVVATTTNNTGWEHQGWDTIKVGVFHRDESINYLLTATESTDRDAADALADCLGDLPLAIAQAAATAHNERWTLQYYFKCLEEYDLARVIHPVRGDSYTQGVASALALAVDTAIKHLVRGTPGTARRQLGALAVLAESGVPTRWLDPLWDPRNEAELLEADQDVAKDAHLTLAELIDRSLVQQTTDDKRTTMLHRLLARTLREEWTETQEDDLYDHAAYYLTTVNDPPTRTACSNNQHDVGQHSRDNMKALGTRAHPNSDELHSVQEKTLEQIRDGLIQISDLSQFEAELRLTKTEIIEQLHAISVQKHSQAQLHRPDVARVLSDTLEDISYLEMPHEAQKLATAVEYVCATGQRDCDLIPIIQNNYALVMQRAGRVHEAVDRFESLLKEDQEKAHSHFSITLTMRSNLAFAYQNSGQTARAITRLEEILHEDLTGISHDSEIPLIILNSLALAYQNDGRLYDSIPLLEQNLRSYVTLLGNEHHHTQIARNNLAYAYRELGRFDDSLREFEIALSILKRYQQNHQHTLVVTENYALTLRDKARKENDKEAITTAINTLRDCLERHIDLLSQEHPHTLTARNNLADALLDAGRAEESIELHSFNLREHVRVLGPLHPYSLAIINNFASALFIRCRFSESICLLKCCIREYRRILGPDHHEALVVRNTLAAVYRESGNYERALDANQLNLSECQRLLSPDAPQFIRVLNNLALTYYRMDKREDAITEFDRILKKYTACYGKDHILVTTVQSMHDAFTADMARFE